ncbi:MAG: GIY-YIG nuclease family protein [Myxococcota bacterium]
MDEDWHVYLLRCGDGSFYAGIARDVDRRLEMHRSGKGARYTRGRGPLELVARAGPMGRSMALRLELTVKRAPRSRKVAVLTTVSGSEPRSASGAAIQTSPGRVEE